MKVIAFAASPREDGNIDLVTREVVGILEARGIKTELVRLHDKDIQPCSEYYQGVCGKLRLAGGQNSPGLR